MANRNRPRSASSSSSDASREDALDLDLEQDMEQPSAFEVGETTLNIDDVSDEELDSLYFEDDASEDSGFFSVPTVAGLSFIVVGIVYLLTELGVWAGPDLSVIVSALPILAGVLVILLGFGLLSWKSSGSRKEKSKSAKQTKTKEASSTAPSSSSSSKRRLAKSRTDKKLAGVCAGIADYFSLDPTLVRIAFVIGVVASGGPFVLAYLGLAFVMPKAPKYTEEEKRRIIQES